MPTRSSPVISANRVTPRDVATSASRRIVSAAGTDLSMPSTLSIRVSAYPKLLFVFVPIVKRRAKNHRLVMFVPAKQTAQIVSRNLRSEHL